MLTPFSRACYPLNHLGLEDKTLTIVAAMRFGENFVVGADSRVANPRCVYQARKMGFINTPPIVWGWAGNLGVGQAFDEWIRVYEWQNVAWQKLRDDATSTLAELNGKYFGFQRKAGIEPKEQDRTNVLIVGYLNGIGELLESTGEGEWLFHRGDDMSATIGSGTYAFQIAQRSIEDFYKACNGQQLVHDEETFKFLMQLVIATDLYCGLPFGILKVGKSGVSVLQTSTSIGDLGLNSDRNLMGDKDAKTET